MTGIADLKKIFVGGGGGTGIYLAAGNVLQLGSPVNLSQSGNIINVSGVNISAGLTTVLDVNVVSGELLLIKKLSLSGLTSTSANVNIEVEIDGVVVATATVASSSELNVTVFGDTSIGTQQNSSNLLNNIIVKSNLKLSASKTPATSAGASLTYVKLIKE